MGHMSRERVNILNVRFLQPANVHFVHGLIVVSNNMNVGGRFGNRFELFVDAELFEKRGSRGSQSNC